MDRKLASQEIEHIWNHSESSERIDRIRKFLSTRPPYQVLRLLYDEGYCEGDVPKGLIYLVQQLFRSKRECLKWVYENDERLADYSEWQNLRRPSPEKMALVSWICLLVQRRYKWINAKLIHAFAYRQTFFEQHPFRKWPKAKGLYERRDIPKGKSGKRTLWIPIPPLRRIHRELLDLPLRIAQSSLPREVLGGRAKGTGEHLRVGILANAATHLGQRFVATFDLANFFPSVHVGDVIVALQALQCPMVPRLDSEPNETKWTHDAAVLVARLVTHRGRLPQGAPTSPAVANLVFSKFDKQITWRLGSDFIYTRYFDDLTVSLSAQAARKRGIETTSQMEQHVQTELELILKGSRFRLNHRKTRTTSIEHGHKITGLIVSADQVTLPRKTRRVLTALMHQIKRDGLAATAVKHVDGAIHLRTTFDEQRKQHMEQGRRLSLERQAAIMLRSICPDLKLEVPGETSWGGRVVEAPELHEGKLAIRDVERLLALVWREEVVVTDEGAHFVFQTSTDKTIARLRCERNGDFFLLSRRHAVATVKLWHRLRGWYVGLNPGYRDECFASLDKFRMRLKETLDQARIRATKRTIIQTTDIPSAESDISLLRDTGVVRELSGDVWKLYIQFVHQLNAKEGIEAEANPRAANFRSPVLEISHLRTWVPCAKELMTDLLPTLPIKGESAAVDTKGILELIRLLCDLLEEQRISEYETEYKFLKEHVRKSRVHQLGNEDAIGVQRAILGELKRLLTKCLHEQQQFGREEWLKTLAPNPWRKTPAEQLKTAYERFVSLHRKAVWKTTGSPVFRDTSHREISKSPEDFYEAIDAATPDGVRDGLFAFAKRVTRCTTDCLNGDVKTLSDDALEAIRKKQPPTSTKKPSKKDLHEELHVEIGDDLAEFFQIAFAMRNRDAHPDDETQMDDWNRIQKFMAKLLGRRWKPKKGPAAPTRLFQPDDLQLTSLEGTEVKLAILKGICDGLEKVQPIKPTA